MKQILHPDSELKGLLELIEKVGSRDFLRSPKHQKSKERFIGCLFAYAIRRYTEREWFINQLEEPDSSDFTLTAYFERRLAEKPAETAHIQLVALPERIKDINNKLAEIKKIIDKKYSSRYQYESYTMLLIFGNFEGVNDYIGDIFNYVQEKQRCGKFKMVWLLYLISIDLVNSFIYNVNLLWPEEKKTEIIVKLREELGKGIIYPSKYFDKFFKIE